MRWSELGASFFVHVGRDIQLPEPTDADGRRALSDAIGLIGQRIVTEEDAAVAIETFEWLRRAPLNCVCAHLCLAEVYSSGAAPQHGKDLNRAFKALVDFLRKGGQCHYQEDQAALFCEVDRISKELPTGRLSDHTQVLTSLAARVELLRGTALRACLAKLSCLEGGQTTAPADFLEFVLNELHALCEGSVLDPLLHLRLHPHQHQRHHQHCHQHPLPSMGTVCSRRFGQPGVPVQARPDELNRHPAKAQPDGWSYRFELQNSDAWLQHLRQHGFVVVSKVLTQEEAAEAKDLLWQDFERVTPGLSRSDVASWSRWKLSRSGLTTSISQDAGAWYVRGCAGVKQAFAGIWETSDLIVSMDAVIAWRPWWMESKWRPVTEGLHLDQNPFSKPDLDCVQGMVPLVPVTQATGGLQVVPASHTPEAKEQLKEDFPHFKFRGDWCPLGECMKAQLLLAEAGDLILWDSRTVHGGVVGSGGESGRDCDLARLAVTVAMTPRAWAPPDVQQARVRGYETGKNFNHCPHEAGSSTGTLGSTKKKRYTPIALTAAQRSLL